ncbi:MAG TPA: hypothetical protein EYQ74_02840 [Planctomycetes bacterium]|nr:hypothetical protein [Planctomycetota bacterium]HIK62234.1 hypothetical protein [Planctomycetota bacterium]
MKGRYFDEISLGVAFLVAGCSAVQPLARPAWEAHEAGSVGLIGRLGVWDDFHATGHMEAETNFGPVEFDVETQLTGTLGLVGGAEVFLADDVSLQLGLDYWRFKPDPMVPFEFSELGVLEYFLATRWTIPQALFGQERLRPFVGARLTMRPETAFQSKVALIPGSPPAEFLFEGGPSWSASLEAGLSYQLRDNFVGHFQVFYEWPLTESDDWVSMDVVPGFPPLLLDSELDSGGMMVLFGITYFL